MVERLFTIARTLETEVNFRNLRQMHPDLLGMADASIRTIYLDHSLDKSPRQLKCVLAEEIGHIIYPPRPGHVRYHSKQYMDGDCIDRSNIRAIVAQDERLALQWATNVLIPDVDFWRVIGEGENAIYQLVEKFDVEPWFLLLKIGFIRRQARESGIKLKWRDIVSREHSSRTPERGF